MSAYHVWPGWSQTLLKIAVVWTYPAIFHPYCRKGSRPATVHALTHTHTHTHTHAHTHTPSHTPGPLSKLQTGLVT